MGFYQASLWVQERWGDRLRDAWYRRGVLGTAARQVLAAPCTFTIVEKSVSGGPARRSPGSHGARLNLRPLARKKTLLYLAIYCIMFRLLGFSFPSSLLLLLLLFTSCVFVSALVKTLTGKGEQARGSLLDTSDIQDEVETKKKI